eukprot:5706653-Prymnesium_polylepis.1
MPQVTNTSRCVDPGPKTAGNDTPCCIDGVAIDVPIRSSVLSTLTSAGLSPLAFLHGRTRM